MVPPANAKLIGNEAPCYDTSNNPSLSQRLPAPLLVGTGAGRQGGEGKGSIFLSYRTII